MKLLRRLILSSLLVLGSFSNSISAEKITVGMAWPGMQDAVWSTSHKLLKQFAEEAGNIELVFTAADMDVAKQSSDVNDLISRGVDVLLVFPIDSKAISSSVKNAREAGIPSMSFLRQVHADAKHQADVFVGIDAKWQQYSSSKHVFEKMKKDGIPIGDIIWVSGDLRDENSRLRHVGLQEAAAEYGANIVQEVVGNWDPQQAAAGLAPALKSHPNVNMISVASDVMMSGVQQVLQDAGKWHPHGHADHMYYSTVDVFPIGLENLKSNHIDADTIFDVTGMCRLAIEIMQKLAAGETFSEDVLIKGPVYTPENVNDPEMIAGLWG
ncbi:MAG: sugar ABC transporter substrate-binding protein [Alphaproteobacteria bacterium]|jgi:ribose transport system substrate-binding protein|tara:strand:+ start:843 stop:1817 length:975 start_codon:yes stop_codon:yes gene_type:complete